MAASHDNYLAGYDLYIAIAEVRAALGASQMTVEQLWLAYVSVGGTTSMSELSAALTGSSMPSKLQYELISQALNEYFRETKPEPQAS